MYVLALTTVRQSAKTIARALELADQEHKKLFVLFVVDDAVVKEAVQDMSQNSFLDAASAQAVAGVLAQEYIERGDAMLQDITQQARTQGVKVETSLHTGSLFDELRQLVQQSVIEKIIMTRSDRSQFSRVVFGSPLEEFQSSVDVPIEIVED